jgi:inorganic pyrophosphatase
MDLVYILVIYVAVFLGLLWALINAFLVMNVTVKNTSRSSQKNITGYENDDNYFSESNQIALIESIGYKIERGSYEFLKQENCAQCVFTLIFGIIIMIVVDFYGSGEGFTARFYTTLSFLAGATVSIICGWIGMTIAVKANYRTAYQAM